MKFAQKSGGGGYKRNNKNRSIKHYFVTLNAEKQLGTPPSYKTKYSTLSAATQIVSWLLVFCALLVLAMTPIFSSKKSAPLDAGQTSDGVQFTNAPWTQVNTASKPLFTGENTVDGEVLYDLLAYINSTTVWNGVTKNNTTPISGSKYTALTCEDFGKLDTSTKNAQLLVTLYKDTIVNSSSKAVQWQVVYRSMDDTSDVLTLYMNDTYTTTSAFDNYSSKTTCNNYLTSLINTSGTTDSSGNHRSILRDFVSTGNELLSCTKRCSKQVAKYNKSTKFRREHKL